MIILQVQKGLTLLEMLVTIAIIAIVLTVVAPSVQSILIKNRIVGEINEVSGIVQFARHTAIDEQAVTLLCPSTDFKDCTNNWNDPKIVFIDLNQNSKRDEDEPLLVGSSNTSSVNIMTGPNSPMRFQESGAINSPSTIKLCHTDSDVAFARAITVSLQGRVKMSRDTNNDGVHEDNGGNALSCS